MKPTVHKPITNITMRNNPKILLLNFSHQIKIKIMTTDIYDEIQSIHIFGLCQLFSEKRTEQKKNIEVRYGM